MPTRMLHEKICDSVTLAELTGDEERLFHRLVVKADDYGRFHADPRLILGACLPLFVDKIELEQVQAWRDRLAEVGLITLYTVDGREYLQLVTWSGYQRQRDSKPKFPPPLEGAETRGESPQAAETSGSRVVKTGFPGAVDVDVSGGRGPVAREPQAAAAQNGAAAPGRGRTKAPELANGVAPRPPARPPPKLEPGEEWIEPGHPEYSPLVGRYKRVRV